MSSFRIANVIVDDNLAFHAAPTLYARSSCIVIPGATPTEFSVEGPGSVDFTTFFNALSVAKWRRYTVAQTFCLHLELRGGACAVSLTYAGKLASEPTRDEDTRIELPASSDWQRLDLPLRNDARDVLAGFCLEAHGRLEMRDSYYVTEVADEQIRPVELAIATTTFRKEDYITHNVELVRDQVIHSQERAASHVTMHVVDNGRTLDADALEGDGIYVHPNPNAGGAGGFARGMMEALAQEVPATHVLLMDDDVTVSPEAFARTWNLLSLVRDEWSDAFVSGAMMSSLQPDLRWEDTGYVTAEGYHMSRKPKYIVSNFAEAVRNETIEPNLQSYPDFAQAYAAWWYCCIPARTIRREGLPLPLFVRHDDVEYSLRCKPRLITMNGICIWHDEFTHRYNAAVERYQTMRNCFIMQASTNGAPMSNFEDEIRRNMMIELLKFNYTDAELIMRGFEDFLRGPSFFSAPGKAEETYMAANRDREQLVDYDELREEALAQTGIDLDDYDYERIVGEVPLGITRHGRVFNVAHTQLLERTLNGQLAPERAPKVAPRLKPFDGEPVAVIEAAGWATPYGRIYGKDILVVVDPYTRRGTIRRRDDQRCRQIWKRFQDDLARYRKERDRICAEYAEARPQLTSEEFWRDYLGVDR